MKQNLKIIKPKTRPIQIEPWFFRYLTLLELKVVGAILAYADIKDRQSNSFPSNRTIAFFCGNDVIEEDTKTYEKYSSLNEKEKENFINKKIKYSINTIKQAKKSLEKKGLLTREIVGPKGKQIVYMTLDLNGKKNNISKSMISSSMILHMKKMKMKKKI